MNSAGHDSGYWQGVGSSGGGESQRVGLISCVRAETRCIPDEVGLVPGTRRRAPGLRREELAMLAGISAEYYLRIERGRAHNPSPQILGALARALRLGRQSHAASARSGWPNRTG